MTPQEAGAITGILAHVAGILEQLPLEEYVLHQRGTVIDGSGPAMRLTQDPEANARYRRYMALRAAATQAMGLADEMAKAVAFRRAEQYAHQEIGELAAAPEPGAAILVFPTGAGHGRCKCPMGECSHREGLDGPA